MIKKKIKQKLKKLYKKKLRKEYSRRQFEFTFQLELFDLFEYIYTDQDQNDIWLQQVPSISFDCGWKTFHKCKSSLRIAYEAFPGLSYRSFFKYSAMFTWATNFINVRIIDIDKTEFISFENQLNSIQKQTKKEIIIACYKKLKKIQTLNIWKRRRQRIGYPSRGQRTRTNRQTAKIMKKLVQDLINPENE